MAGATKHLRLQSLARATGCLPPPAKCRRCSVLGCHALGLGTVAMLDCVEREAPDAIFLGTRLVTEGGATSLVCFIETIALLKQSFPHTAMILGGFGRLSDGERDPDPAPQVDVLLGASCEVPVGCSHAQSIVKLLIRLFVFLRLYSLRESNHFLDFFNFRNNCYFYIFYAHHGSFFLDLS